MVHPAALPWYECGLGPDRPGETRWHGPSTGGRAPPNGWVVLSSVAGKREDPNGPDADSAS